MMTSGANSSQDLVGGPFAVLESDPGVFTTLFRKLGVRGLEVTEIYDIEPWSVDHLDPHGLIFCYLCTDESEEVDDDEDLEDPDAEQVWFANQLSDDACAAQAILNVLLNRPDVEIGDKLRLFRTMTERMSPVIRGLAISSSHFIRTAQNSLARPADVRGAVHAIAAATLELEKSKVGKANNPVAKKRKTSGTPVKSKLKAVEDSDNKQEAYHFIGYVPAHNKIWELDGLRRSAREVGELVAVDSSGDSRRGWMDIVRPALRMRMQRYMAGSDHIRYNLLAIVDDNYQKASDELEMLKRERDALERRLNEVYPEGWGDKVDKVLLDGARETFTTSIRPSSKGQVFAPDFGSRKTEKDIEILDMPERSLPAAWETCVRAAIPAKLAVEEEMTKSKDAHTEQIKRTFDYEPFITQFVTCMHNEGLLDAALRGRAENGAAQAHQQQTPVKPRTRGRGRK